MARTLVAVLRTQAAGILDCEAVDTPIHVTDGAMFVNDGNTRLWVKNAGAGVHILTFPTPRTVGPSALTVQDPPFSVGIGKYALLGPFDPTDFNVRSGADNGKMYVNCDGTGTEVTIIPFKD